MVTEPTGAIVKVVLVCPVIFADDDKIDVTIAVEVECGDILTIACRTWNAVVTDICQSTRSVVFKKEIFPVFIAEKNIQVVIPIDVDERRMDVDLDEAFGAVLEHSASAGDLPSLLDGLGLPTSLAAAAQDPSHDTVIRDDTDEALARVGGDIGTPVLSFVPPDGPAFFGPVISESPDDDDEALALWDAVTTLARWPGFAELKRSLREFPMTRVTAPIAGRETQVS